VRRELVSNDIETSRKRLVGSDVRGLVSGSEELVSPTVGAAISELVGSDVRGLVERLVGNVSGNWSARQRLVGELVRSTVGGDVSRTGRQRCRTGRKGTGR
jgi:hypothetical protein